MTSFNKEKEKYEKLSKQEAELNESFNNLRKKYSNFKDQIDKRKKKEKMYQTENEALEKRITQLTRDESEWEEKKCVTKRMLD